MSKGGTAGADHRMFEDYDENPGALSKCTTFIFLSNIQFKCDSDLGVMNA